MNNLFRHCQSRHEESARFRKRPPYRESKRELIERDRRDGRTQPPCWGNGTVTSRSRGNQKSERGV